MQFLIRKKSFDLVQVKNCYVEISDYHVRDLEVQ